MRYYTFSIFIVLILISGCKPNTIPIPSNANSSMILSHLTNPTLSFIDTNQDYKETSVGVDVNIADIEKVEGNSLVFTGKEDPYLYKLNLENGLNKKLTKVGTSINQLLYVSEKNQLLMADSENNQVLVYDTKEEEIIHTYAVGEFPLSMGYNASSHILFVLNQKSSSVTKIDLSKRRVIQTISVPNHPSGLFVDDGHFYVGGHGPVEDKLNEFVYRFDTSTGQMLNKIHVGLMPVGFYSNKSNSHLYVICHGSHELYKINKASLNVDGKVKVGANPFDVNGEGEHVFVTNLDSNTLTVVNAEKMEVKNELNVKEGPLTIVVGGG